MRLDNDRLNDFIWNCKLAYNLGKLAPKQSIDLVMSVIPLRSGFIVNISFILVLLFIYLEFNNIIKKNKTLSGISITDLFLKRIHEFTQIAHIFVQSKNEL